MTGLIVLNALLIAFTDADFPWAVFPLVGWGTGLTLHYIYGFRRADEEAHARQRQVEKYAARTKEPV
jgi:2TM domain-containing protein